MKPLQVIVSGGYRTGSTFIYMALVDIFKTVFNGDFEYRVKLNSEIQNFKKFIPAIFKSHDFYPVGGNDFKIIHTIRNPFDILSSLKKCRPALPDYVAEVKEILKRDRFFKAGENVLILPYENFFGKEILAIEEILKFLNLDFAPAEKAWLAAKHSFKNVRTFTDFLEPNNPTPYMARHVSNDPAPGNYVNYLDSEEIRELTEFLNDLKILDV